MSLRAKEWLDVAGALMLLALAITLMWAGLGNIESNKDVAITQLLFGFVIASCGFAVATVKYKRFSK